MKAIIHSRALARVLIFVLLAPLPIYSGHMRAQSASETSATSSATSSTSGKNMSTASAVVDGQKIVVQSSGSTSIKTLPKGAELQLGDLRLRVKGQWLYSEDEILAQIPADAKELSIRVTDGFLRFDADGEPVFEKKL